MTLEVLKNEDLEKELDKYQRNRERKILSLFRRLKDFNESIFGPSGSTKSDDVFGQPRSFKENGSQSESLGT